MLPLGQWMVLAPELHIPHTEWGSEHLRMTGFIDYSFAILEEPESQAGSSFIVFNSGILPASAHFFGSHLP